jgi:hypothetical protein
VRNQVSAKEKGAGLPVKKKTAHKSEKDYPQWKNPTDTRESISD